MAAHSEAAYEHEHAEDKNRGLHHVHPFLAATEDQLTAEHVRFGVPLNLLVLVLLEVLANEVLPLLLLRDVVKGNDYFQNGLGQTEEILDLLPLVACTPAKQMWHVVSDEA